MTTAVLTVVAVVMVRLICVPGVLPTKSAETQLTETEAPSETAAPTDAAASVTYIDGTYIGTGTTEAGFLGVLSISDEAAITSGGYERYFVGDDGQTYWHIIDPDTGAPVDNGLISVTLVGKSGLVCDGLSTALFVMGLEEATRYWRSAAEEFEAILVSDDGNIFITEGLQEKFTLPQSAEDAALAVIARG